MSTTTTASSSSSSSSTQQHEDNTNAWSVPLASNELREKATQEITTTFHSPMYAELQSKKQSSSTTITSAPSANYVPYLTDSQQQSNLSLAIQKKIVIDSGAIIHSAKLEKYGSEFYTTPLVLTEIKSSKSKQKLLLFPFEIKVRNPTSESMAVVNNYAQKTGDYAGLSKTDLSVLALTYELELEVNGDVNIKPEPPSLAIDGYRKVQLTPFTELLKELSGVEHEEESEEESEEELEEESNQENNEEEDDGWETPKKVVKNIRKGADGAKVNNNNKNDDEEEEEYQANSDDEYEDNEEEGGEWITHDNIDRYKNRSLEGNDEQWDDQSAAIITDQVVNNNNNNNTESSSSNSSTPAVIVPERKVGCITTDFSMQNVLLHIGLNLVSVDGRRIRHLTRFVNRCYACDTLVPDQRRIFCPNCGNDTLKKVSCVINDKGEAKFYYNPKRKINTRGAKYVIPLPKGGRNSRDPILREDQLSLFKEGKPHKSKISLSKRGGTDSFGGDVWEPEYTFESSFAGGAHKGRPYERFNRVWNGYGRRNPNESVKTGANKKKKSNRA